MNLSLECVQVSRLPDDLAEVSKLLLPASYTCMPTDTSAPSAVECEVEKLPCLSFTW